MDRQVDRYALNTNSFTDRQLDSCTKGIKIDRQTGRQIDRQTDRQIWL